MSNELDRYIEEFDQEVIKERGFDVVNADPSEGLPINAINEEEYKFSAVSVGDSVLLNLSTPPFYGESVNVPGGGEDFLGEVNLKGDSVVYTLELELKPEDPYDIQQGIEEIFSAYEELEESFPDY